MKKCVRICVTWLMVACLSVFAVHSVMFCAAAETPDLSGFPEEVAVFVNKLRAENGLEPLQLAPILLEISEERAIEQQEAYGHNRPGGDDWFTIVGEKGLDTNCYAAENVAAGYETPESVVEAWKNSPAHCAAMLGEHYQYIGVGVSYLEEDPNYFFTYWEMVLISSETPLEGAWIPGTEKTTTSTTTETQPQDTLFVTKMGDVNMDQEVSLADAVLMQQILLGQIEAEPKQILQADCYQDGVLDHKDVVTLMQFFMHLVPRIPVVPT